MIDQGCLENVEHMFTFHNAVLEPKGQIMCCPKEALAASQGITITAKLFKDISEIKHGDIQDFCRCEEHHENFAKIQKLLESDISPFQKDAYFDPALPLLYLSRVIVSMGQRIFRFII